MLAYVKCSHWCAGRQACSSRESSHLLSRQSQCSWQGWELDVTAHSLGLWGSGHRASRLPVQRRTQGTERARDGHEVTQPELGPIWAQVALAAEPETQPFRSWAPSAPHPQAPPSRPVGWSELRPSVPALILAASLTHSLWVCFIVDKMIRSQWIAPSPFLAPRHSNREVCLNVLRGTVEKFFWF